jgi:hypothetical protein
LNKTLGGGGKTPLLPLSPDGFYDLNSCGIFDIMSNRTPFLLFLSSADQIGKRERCDRLRFFDRRFLPKQGRRTFLAAACLLTALTGCHKSNGTGAGTNPVTAKLAPRQTAKPTSLPLPPMPAGGVRGIYLTGWTAGGTKSLERLCAIADRTEINAMVIDVKDDGQVSYDVDVPLASDIHASLKMYNVDRVIATLDKHHIWPIARIACMRDTPLAKAHPELAVHGPDGQVWHDRSKHYWLNPYKKEVWDYNVDVALDAIKHGFKEIQFDYVRFPSEGKISILQYPGKPAGSLRSDQINAFLKYASEKIHAQGAWFSADVFGLTSTVERRYGRTHPKLTGPKTPIAGAKRNNAKTIPVSVPGSSPASISSNTNALSSDAHRPTAVHAAPGDDKIAGDMGIGQRFTEMAGYVNYMCPMCYPSHYAHGEFGIPNPNAEPYKVIMKSVGDSRKLIADVTTCKLRPWIQDFSLGQPHYGPAEVKAQIKALNDLGIHEYLLWNARCRYTEAALGKKTSAKVATTK